MTRITIEGQAIQVDLHAEGGTGASTQEIDAFLEEGRGGFTIEQLQDAFDTVKDREHWKNPIDAVIDAGQREVLSRAIPWYTGTEAEFHAIEGDPCKLRVTAPGYFAGPCN